MRAQLARHFVVSLSLAAALLALPAEAQQAERIELQTYKDVLGKLPKGQDVWYMFDQDNTTMKTDAETLIGTHQWQNHLAEKIKERRPHLSDMEVNWRAALALTFVQPYVNVRLTEPEIKKVFKEIDKGGSYRFALTARMDRSRHATLAQFDKLGIKFAGHSPVNIYRQPLLPDGLAMAENKGEYLKNLLKNAARPPKTIVMFDDRPYNLDSLQKAVDEWNQGRPESERIKFIGYRYANSDANFAELQNPRLAEIADIQANLFFEEKTIVPASVIGKELDANNGVVSEEVERNVRGVAKRMRCEKVFN